MVCLNNQIIWGGGGGGGETLVVPSRKHAYIILTPLNRTFI